MPRARCRKGNKSDGFPPHCWECNQQYWCVTAASKGPRGQKGAGGSKLAKLEKANKELQQRLKEERSGKGLPGQGVEPKETTASNAEADALAQDINKPQQDAKKYPAMLEEAKARQAAAKHIFSRSEMPKGRQLLPRERWKT